MLKTVKKSCTGARATRNSGAGYIRGAPSYIGTIIFVFPRPDTDGVWFQETEDGESSFILNGVTYRGWNYHESWLEFL